ncbi:MAG: glycosyltransferase family 4 protein [Acidobacteriota bacterium]|nr:glycosyltransferase family 4 protein [Acidobacteriota bacterium]
MPLFHAASKVNLTPSRPKILLVPNIAAWIIGEMAMHIETSFRDEFDFFMLPESLLWRRKDLCQALWPHLSLIHCLNESSAGMVREFGGADPPPVITWIHHVTQWSPYHEQAVQESSALIACTPAWKSTIEESSGHRLPVEVIRHGVDSVFFNPEARCRLKLPANAFLIGFFATKGSDLDGNRKGIPVLIEVLKAAMPKIPNAHVVFAGPGWEPVVADLGALGLSASCLGYIRRSDMPGLFASLDAYLMTSGVEGGPVTVLESMACGTPVVATRVGLVPDVVSDGVNGFTSPVGDVAGLTAALLQLASDRDLAARIGAAARHTAQSQSWERNLQPLREIYQRYGRAPTSTVSAPAWTSNPERFCQVAYAADGIARTMDALRHHQPVGRSFGALREMLAGTSFPDRLRGAAMVRKLYFRV